MSNLISRKSNADSFLATEQWTSSLPCRPAHLCTCFVNLEKAYNRFSRRSWGKRVYGLGFGMRVSTFKTEAMVLCLKPVDCSLWVGSELLPQAKEFKYLGAAVAQEVERVAGCPLIRRSVVRSPARSPAPPVRMLKWPWQATEPQIAPKGIAIGVCVRVNELD